MRYEWRADEKQTIENDAETEVGKEHRVVVVIRAVFLAYERIAESAINNAAKNGVKDQADANETIFVRRQQTSQYYPDKKRNSLSQECISRTPHRALDCFVF